MENDGLLHELMAQDDPIEWFGRLAAENDPALHEALREALLHPEREVRIYAAVMLAQEFHDVSALPGLVDALLDWNRQVRSAAAEAVWEIGDMDPAGLIRALHFERGAVRDAIVEALAIVGWFPDDIEAEVTYYIAIRDWHQLVVVGSPAVPGLISALSDPGFGRGSLSDRAVSRHVRRHVRDRRARLRRGCRCARPDRHGGGAGSGQIGFPGTLDLTM
jgi:hypothetical protein